MRKQEKESLDNLPCAGITLIRFYGFDLSPPADGGVTPRGICALSSKAAQNYDRIFFPSCNFFVPLPVTRETLI